MRNFIICFFILILPLLQSCSSNSDGSTTIGMKGSPVWNRLAPQSEIQNYYANMEVYELCLEWEEKWRSKNTRKNIAKALKGKGENPLRCHNSSSDEAKRISDETNRVLNETKKTKRKLESITRGLRTKCILNGGSWSGSACL